MGEGGHREFVRVASGLEIEYSCDSPTSTGRLVDLSEGGAFIDTATPFEEGTELDFRLELPGESEPVVGRAVVRWRQETVGMGIRFVGLDDEDRERLRFYVASEYFKSPD